MKKQSQSAIVERTILKHPARSVYKKNVQVERISYRSGHRKVTGFLLTPQGARRKKFPCVIYNRGGSLEFGAIDAKRLFGRMSLIASWGYVVAASQYSGNDGSEGKDEFGGMDLEDVLALRNVLREVPQADTARIGMVGGSRGGMMTYMALARVKWVKAAVIVAGLADLQRCARLRPKMKTQFRKLFGGSAREIKRRSAVAWPEEFPKKTPLLLMHGTADWRVSPEDSLDLARRCIAHNVPCRLILFEGGDHQLTEYTEERHRLTREWLDRFVKDEECLPNLKAHGP